MVVNKSIMVIGIDRLGSKVATTLIEKGHKVTVLEKNQDRVDSFLVKEPNASVIKTDVTNDNFSAANNLVEFDVVVLTIIHSVEASLNVANQIQKAINKTNKAIYFIACVNDDHHYDFLSKIGVNHIVHINEVMSQQLICKITQQFNTADFFSIDGERGCFKISLSDDLSNQKFTLEELELDDGSDSKSIQCLGITRKDKFVPLDRWQKSELLQKGDQLVLIGRFREVKELEKKLTKKNN